MLFGKKGILFYIVLFVITLNNLQIIVFLIGAEPIKVDGCNDEGKPSGDAGKQYKDRQNGIIVIFKDLKST